MRSMWNTRVDGRNVETPPHPLNSVSPTPSATKKKHTTPDADDRDKRDDHHSDGEMRQTRVDKNLWDIREIGRPHLEIGHVHPDARRVPLYLYNGHKAQGFRGRAVIDRPMLAPEANTSSVITRVDWFRRARSCSMGLKDQLSAVRSRWPCSCLTEESPGQILLIRDLALEPSAPAGDEPTKCCSAQTRDEYALFLRQHHLSLSLSNRVD